MEDGICWRGDCSRPWHSYDFPVAHLLRPEHLLSASKDTRLLRERTRWGAFGSYAARLAFFPGFPPVAQRREGTMLGGLVISAYDEASTGVVG